MDTVWSGTAGVPFSQDTTNNSVIRNSDHHMYVQQIVVCSFVLFLLAIVMSVLLRNTDSDCPFGIFKLFFIQIPHTNDVRFVFTSSCVQKDARLITLFVVVCVQWFPTHIVLCFCFVLLRLVYPMLLVSLDCPFLIRFLQCLVSH